jgi:hypothetical protein
MDIDMDIRVDVDIVYVPMDSLSGPTEASPGKRATFAPDVVERKSAGSARKKASYRSSPSRKLRIGCPGSKRHTRYLNSVFLDPYSTSDTDTDTEGEEDDVTFFVEEWHSAYADLFDNAHLWETWRDISFEAQDKLMREMCPEVVEVVEVDSDDEGAQAEAAEKKKHRRKPHLSKDLRRTLKKAVGTPLLNDLEALLIAFIEDVSPGDLSRQHPTGELSGLYSLQASPDSLILSFPDPYHRLLFHGLCTYYGLYSKSVSEEDGDRSTIVKKPRGYRHRPHMALEQYLSSNKARRKPPRRPQHRHA